MAHSQHLAEVSPAAHTVGRELLEVDSRTGVVRLAFLARPEFANRHGSVAGGFLAAMLDSTTASAILSFLPDGATLVTKELRVSFERPAPLGELFGAGRVTQRGQREMVSEGELSDPEGNVVARASAIFRVLTKG